MSQYTNDEIETLIAQHERMVERGAHLVPAAWIEVQERSAALLRELLDRRAADAMAIADIDIMKPHVDMVILAGTRHRFMALDKQYLPLTAQEAK